GLTRGPQALVVSLAPDLAEGRAARAGGPDPLTFSAHLPLPSVAPPGSDASGAPQSGDRGASSSEPAAAPWAELRGGPVWLSQLGLKDGDFGLSDVSRASVESDARVELSADGETVHVDGGGKLHRLAIKNAKLAQGT